jgi:heme/copper-type cytochrome/quinol oxidase subunit 4
MASTLLTCTYIFYVDDFNTHMSRKSMLTLEKIKLPLKNPAKPSELEETLRVFINHSKKYILLFYHAVLTFLLTFDKKDFLTLMLLTIEAITIPLHLHYYLKSNTTKSYIGPMYRLFIPIFAAAIFFVVFRYVLFFQKYRLLTAGSPSSTTSTSR